VAPSKKVRPLRTLAVFCLGIAILFGLVAANGTWKPGLGLDLRGGTEISMEAENPEGGGIPAESLEEARNIIDQRVNGSGVTGARVASEGGDVIQVSIPGQGQMQSELADRVRQTAKLRFRLVACQTSQPGACSSGGGSQLDPNALGGGASSKQRAGVGFSEPSEGPSGAAEAQPSGDSSAQPSASASASAGTGTGADTAAQDPNQVVSVEEAVKFMRNPDPALAQQFSSFKCPGPDDEPVDDVPGKPLLTCDDQGETYLLSPAIIEGTELSGADFGVPQQGTGYVVTLDFHSRGNEAFADATQAIGGTGETFAIALDGRVISNATAPGRISGGAQIEGDFTQTEAKELANNLKYGSLPLDFPEENISTRVIGPSLAGNQLSAGLWAGLVGLILVALFSILYYRGFSLVVIGSLLVAGVLTYGFIVLLSETAGVTLDLPGVAGLIVGIGITADSFIVYFERIRDEMRDGRSMRVAVDNGWVRARNTSLAADAVSLLAAFLLYIFATNEVKGFAFMLGLATLIDIAVFFWFTRPVVKLFSGLRFFNRGHKFSGLDKSALGLDTATAGGKA